MESEGSDLQPLREPPEPPRPVPSTTGKLLKVLMILWTILCAGYVLLMAWKHRGNEPGASFFSMLGLRIGLDYWFYGIVPLGVLYLVMGRTTPSRPPSSRGRPRHVAARGNSRLRGSYRRR